MTDILRRAQAPVADNAWNEIDEVSMRILKPFLSARAVVDFSGPHGWDFEAVNVGRVKVVKENKSGGPNWGLREVLPLIEVRVPFTLDQWQLDDISRGAKDADLGPVEEAARNIATFEETVVYKGCADAQVKGVLESASHKAMRMPSDPEQYPTVIAEGADALRGASIGGPYALILGTKPYRTLQAHTTRSGQPLIQIVERMIDGEVLWSPALQGGVLMSTRGGDFELTVGQDLSIGYNRHDSEKVELYFTESFTFRVLEPAAAVEFKVAASK